MNRFLLFCGAFLILAASCQMLSPVFQGQTQTVYVDALTPGSDSNAGTLSHPWATVAHAHTTAPTARVMVKAGDGSWVQCPNLSGITMFAAGIQGSSSTVLYDLSGAGNNGTASNVVWNASHRNGAYFSAANTSAVTLARMTAFEGSAGVGSVMALFQPSQVGQFNIWDYGTASNNQGYGFALATNGQIDYWQYGNDTYGGSYPKNSPLMLIGTRSSGSGTLYYSYPGTKGNFAGSFTSLAPVYGQNLLGEMLSSGNFKITGTLYAFLMVSHSLSASEISAVQNATYATNSPLMIDVDASSTYLPTYAGDPWIIQSGGTYYDFYWGGITSSKTYCLLATSTDANTWTQSGSNPILSPSASGWDSQNVSQYSVVEVSSTSWNMYYSGASSATAHAGFGLATASSPSGSWTKYGSNPILTPGLEPDGKTSGYVVSPGVVLVGGTYYMFYSAQATSDDKWRIYLATSTDGQTFTRDKLILDASSNNGDWDYGSVTGGVPQQAADGTWFITYIGFASIPAAGSESSPGGQGFASSSGAIDGTYTKYGSNPFLASGAFPLAAVVWHPFIAYINGSPFDFFNAGYPSNTAAGNYRERTFKLPVTIPF